MIWLARQLLLVPRTIVQPVYRQYWGNVWEVWGKDDSKTDPSRTSAVARIICDITGRVLPGE